VSFTGAVAVDKDQIVSQSAVHDSVSSLGARQHASLPGRRCRKAVSQRYISKSRQCLKKSGCTLRCMKTSAGTRLRNVFPCNYCEATVHGYTRHLRQCHFDEPEVVAILQKHRKEQKVQFDVLRNRAVFRHNLKVLEHGDGQIIVNRRSTKVQSASEYLPCPSCLTFLRPGELWRHHRRCPVARKKGMHESQVLVSARALVAPKTCDSRYNEFRRHVLDRLRNDEVANTAKSDQLIQQYGQSLFDKWGPYRAVEICQRMRQLCHLLMEINSQHDTKVTLTEAVKAGHFDEVVKATERLCIASYDMSGRKRFQKPSIGLKIGHALIKCARLQKKQSIIEGNEVAEKEVDRFIALHQSDWVDLISSPALVTLKLNKMNKPEQLPMTEDLLKMKDYLEEKLGNFTAQLQANFDYSTYRTLLELCLASVIIFNKRRGGEASRLLMSAYTDRPVWSDIANQEIVRSLTEMEKRLLRR